MDDEYLKLLRLFRAEGVEYLVVDGYTVIAHGFPRTTADLDLWLQPTPASARRAVRALVRFGYDAGEFEEAAFLTAPNFLSFCSNGAWIDLMTEVLGVEFAVARAGALELTFADVPVRYIGLAALRRVKQATGWPQDLRDLENLPE